MTMERRRELLNNMSEYLDNRNVDFEAVGAGEGIAEEEAFNACLGYIVELVGNDGDVHFFEDTLGFTREELLAEGMDWVYEE